MGNADGFFPRLRMRKDILVRLRSYKPQDSILDKVSERLEEGSGWREILKKT